MELEVISNLRRLVDSTYCRCHKPPHYKHCQNSIPRKGNLIKFLSLLQKYHIYREVVAIATHPDAAAEGAEGVAVVASSVLFQELLVVDLGVLELVGRIVGGEQSGRDDSLVEDTGYVPVGAASEP